MAVEQETLSAGSSLLRRGAGRRGARGASESGEEAGALEQAIARARQALLDRQHAAGYWVGELEGDSILESEYILLRFILKQDDDPQLPLIANYLRRLQRSHGGWVLYPGGGADLSATVKAYFALKLLGDPPDAPHMARARQKVLEMGGAELSNSFSKFYLAALGQVPYRACPTIPPEIILLPSWAWFNMYAVSAWTRTMILPLAITTTTKPLRELPPERGIRELFAGDPAHCPTSSAPGKPRGWRKFFLVVDRLLKAYEKLPFQPLRSLALKKSEQWLIEHMDGSEGLGAIFPPMVYILVALRALGYPADHPLILDAEKHLRALQIPEGDAIRIQPCHSPVWDTGIALCALAEAEASPAASEAATRWLLEKECRTRSDWSVNCPDAPAAGWYFEFSNPHYPDVDDTAMVAMALRRVGEKLDGGQRRLAQEAADRGCRWLLAMQNEDGGWAAFDRTRDRPLFEQIPFADHNAMQDPSCPDITGRVLESLGWHGLRPEHPAVRKALRYLGRCQDRDGSWWGRWGVNHVYGTWQVLVGLKSVGLAMETYLVRRAANWLQRVQQSDGSWGETCASYEDPSLKGTGQSTPSQTAWGMMGLLAANGPDDPGVKRAAQWLIEHQEADGAWEERWFTGTGFPRVFYLKYHLYRLYFPLMALARWRRALGAS